MAMVMAIIAPTVALANELRSGFDLEESQDRCAPDPGGRPELYYTDFYWHMSLREMRRRFEEIYRSGKRIPLRAFYSQESGRFFIPLRRRWESGLVPIQVEFIRNVTRHIELSLRARYAEFVFQADMGHAHLYLTRKRWNSTYRTHTGSLADLYTLMLADPEMRPMYHTSEQLMLHDRRSGELLRDRDLMRRYWNRNLLATNDGSDRLDVMVQEPPAYNTVVSVDGHRGYSAGYFVSASHLGCFGYLDVHGMKRYFDIGLTDLRRDPRLDRLIEP